MRVECRDDSRGACWECEVGGEELRAMRETHIGLSYSSASLADEDVDIEEGSVEAELTFLKAAILAPASDLDPIPLIASVS